MKTINPKFSYRIAEGPSHPDLAFPRGEGEAIVRQGCKGLRFSQLHSGFALLKHTLNERRGAVSFWILPLDDFGPNPVLPQHGRSNPGHEHLVLLSDRESITDPSSAQFAVVLNKDWHPVFYAKWHKGSTRELNRWEGNRTGPYALANYLRLHRERWVNVCCTWDHEAYKYCLYVNAVKVGTNDVYREDTPPPDPASPIVYGAAPRVAYGQVDFFDKALDPEQVRAHVEASAYPIHKDVLAELKATHEGAGVSRFSAPDIEGEGWKERLILSLTQPRDFLAFYHQGANNGTSIGADGLRVATPGFTEGLEGGLPPGGDQTRQYLFTRETFEGDLYVSFDFELHRHGGLCLLMTQAAGMQGEDFLHTYHPRTDGSMSMVCWEDVRNYHWEFVREMHDIRNDLMNHGLIKNPWHCPLAYQVVYDKWELGRTYRLSYVQTGNRIVGAIDDTVVFDVEDSPWSNNGPVLRNGAVAIRCMMKTNMTFRNLRIYNRG